MSARFVVARNPDTASSLPFLLRLPVDGGPLILKAKDTWPRTGPVYCHRADAWPDDVEVVVDVDVRVCERRGRAIDLVLDRGREHRSQLVFTTMKGREAIFWQTPRTAAKARPGVRMPKRRASREATLRILVDTRERYGWRFTHQQAETARQALPAGDYATEHDGRVCAAVERKSVADLAGALVDGSLGFALAELAALPRAAVVVEGAYAELFKLEHVPAGFVVELVASAQVRYPHVPIVFAGSRKLAEEYAFRFLGAARAEAAGDASYDDRNVRKVTE